MAVFTLPPDMIGFYKKHIEYISEHATDADRRRNVVPDEAPRHYIDIDHYGEKSFDEMPLQWKDAVKKFTEDTLKQYGILPWHIQTVMYNLQEAFMDEDVKAILRYSADLGHYVADAHVPLHTTENYNGQLTNQKGIHGFWESRLPELFSDKYDFWTGAAVYIEKPLEKTWKTIKQSHLEVDSVLHFERELNAKFTPDKKYSFENKGGKSVRVYSFEYSSEYNNMLGDMVERRMKASIIMLGSLWYTAWINSGKPNLNNLKKENFIEEKNKELHPVDDEH